jgi:hypothetical protein
MEGIDIWGVSFISRTSLWPLWIETRETPKIITKMKKKRVISTVSICMVIFLSILDFNFDDLFDLYQTDYFSRLEIFNVFIRWIPQQRNRFPIARIPLKAGNIFDKPQYFRI